MEKKKYIKNNLEVVWEPGKCIHSGICAKSLSAVFKPKERPWIQLDGATEEAIIEAVKKCPSGALSIGENAAATNPLGDVEILPDGPIIIKGDFTLKNEDGTETNCSKVTALCRCGQSKNKPYCDGSHKK